MLKLYALTIPLPDRLDDRILQFRKEMAERFCTVAALKPMDFMPLQQCFVYDDAHLPALQTKLGEVFDDTAPFRVDLENFGAFPAHTIFVAIRNFFPFIELRDRLHRRMPEETALLRALGGRLTLTPHITVAYRDLTADAFYRAWSDFCEREFIDHFHADDAHLMEHRGKWRTIRAFPFRLTARRGQGLVTDRFCA